MSGRIFSKIYEHKIFYAILALAAFLRFFLISANPPSLNWDEVSHGYNAYSILKTGQDEWGQAFPIVNFRAYGDYPLPLNLYLTIPFEEVFGLNEFSIRLPHAILGILTVAASYFLALGITKKKKIGLLTAFLVAIDPWFVFTSRFVIQSNLSVFFLIASLAAFFNRQKNKYLLPLSVLFLGLTLFSYHSTRIFSPLLLLSVLVIYRKEFIRAWRLRRKPTLLSLLLLLLFFLPLPFILARPEARARSSQVFLIDSGAINRIIEKRNSSSLPPALARLIYNRPSYFLSEFTKNYIGYFSPNFLFLKGGTQYQFSVPGWGLLYKLNLPFFYIGAFYVLSKALKKDKKYLVIVAWLLLSPIPASITKEHFAVLRSTTMLPLPEFFAVLGLYKIISVVKRKYNYGNYLKRVFFGIYLLLLTWGCLSYLKTYFNDYPRQYSQVWQYGYKEVVNFAKSNYSLYEKIIITKKYGEPHEFFLFYWPWDPAKYRNDPNLIRFYKSDWYWVDAFDKFYFVNDWDIPKEEWQDFHLESGEDINCNSSRCLLITSPGNYPKGWTKLESVNFLDNSPAFEIYTNREIYANK